MSSPFLPNGFTSPFLPLQIEPPCSVPAGIPALDEPTGGLPRGCLTEIYGLLPREKLHFCNPPWRRARRIPKCAPWPMHIDSQDSPSHNYDIQAKRESSSRTNLSQSEHDWAFAKRALARGDDPEEVIQQIAQHRARDKSDPQDYARRTVSKATAELKSEADRRTHSSLTTNENNRELGH